MPPLDGTGRDVINGDLTEPPPSDLSEYTWDDRETERIEHGAAESRPMDSKVKIEPPIGEDFDVFVRMLIQTGLVREPELAALSNQLFPAGNSRVVKVLAAELIRLGKLTAYQAAAVLQGKTKGLVIGDYMVLSKIGSGGMGLVLKARHRRQERIVAL